MAAKFDYRPEIDGLRAVAVVPVILLHAGCSLFSGGFIGVDVFLVISGYLITSIILRELEAGTFRFASFYERRARRILPALFFIMFCSIPFAWILMMPVELKGYAVSVTSVVAFASNIIFWRQHGYFDTSAELTPLLHTWSLAVEEQFYIIFPIALLLIWRFGRKASVLSIAAVAIASLLLCEYASQHHPSFNFYWGITRAWELMAGSLCAFVTLRPHQIRDNFLSMLGIVLILYSIFRFDNSVRFPSVYALLPVIGACLIVLFAHRDTVAAWILSMKPLVAVGLISYSAYLWHQPLFAFARIRSIVAPSMWLMAGLALLTLPLAWLTWRYVETPCRTDPMHSGITRLRLAHVSGITACVLIAFGVAGFVTSGFPNRFHASSLASSKSFDLAKRDNGYCFYSVDTMSTLTVGDEGLECKLGSPNVSDPTVLLFGDSFAGHWEPFWDKAGKELGLQVNAVTTNWCFPALGVNFTTNKKEHSRAFDQCVINRLYVKNNAKKYDFIVLSGMWSSVRGFGYTDDVFNLIKFLHDETMARIIIMPSPPMLLVGSVNKFIYSDKKNLILDSRSENLAEEFHRKIFDLEPIFYRVKFVNRSILLGDYFNSYGALTDESLPYSLDGAHISIYGSLKSFEHVRGDEILLKKIKNILSLNENKL